MDELNLQQAKALRDYIKLHDFGSNLEMLAGVAILFISMYLEMSIKEMEKKAPAPR